MPEKTDASAKGAGTAPEQTGEITKGEFRTLREVAKEIGYTKRWLEYLAKTGRITAVKPTGGHWRIPASEVERIKKTGIPPRSRKTEEPEEPSEVTVSGDHAKRTSAGGQRTREEEEIKIRTVSDLLGLFRKKDEE